MSGPFSADEVRRYSRHLILPEFGARGQKKLKAARVLVVGAGGLGSPAAMYLAAAGVGTLGLVDFDVVDLSNLQRQVLHGTPDVGRPKLDSARDRLGALNPEVTLQTHPFALSAEQRAAALRPVRPGARRHRQLRHPLPDQRRLRAQRQARTSRPASSASRGRSRSSPPTTAPATAASTRSRLRPASSPGCGEGGVLGIVPGVIGTLQATEALKLVAGLGEPLIGRLLTFDALAMTFRQFKVKKDPLCPVCGPAPSITALIDYEQFCGTRAPPPGTVREVGPRWLVDHRNSVQLLDVREPGEREINEIAGSISIPLGELRARFDELTRSKDVVVYCKVGERSARAVEFLVSVGFERVFNLEGGIERWADEVDDALPGY